jgi:hypothetical protein
MANYAGKPDYHNKKIVYARKIEDAPKWVISELMKKRTIRAATVHAEYLVRGVKPDFNQIGTIFRPDQANTGYAARHWRMMYKQPLVQKMINQKVVEALFGAGINHTEVIEMYKKAFSMATETERAEAMAKIADRFAVMLGMDKSAMEADESITRRPMEEIQDATFHELIEAERARRDSLDERAESTGDSRVNGQPRLLGASDEAPRDEAQVADVPLPDSGEAA